MTHIFFGDLETFSPTPITNGVHRYAEQVEVLIYAQALDDGPVIVRDLTPGGENWMLQDGELLPAPQSRLAELDAALADDQVEVYFHNSAFDRTVLRHALPDQVPAMHRWRDTMVQAMAHGLPGKLAEISDVVLRAQPDKAKDKAGKALIQLLCKPQKFHFPKMAPFRPQHAGGRDGESNKEYAAAKGAHKAAYLAAKAEAETTWPGRATRETHPAEWHQFLLYAGQDIEAMRAAHKRMPMWNYGGAELALWHLDQAINDRGVCIDLELAECAVNAVDEAQEELRAQTVALTNGEVESATKRDKMLQHILEQYGVDLPDMQMATLERRIADPDLPEGLRELLRIRLQASTTSTSKYRTLIRATSSDGRLRGLLQFCGASRTGRWAGRLWQPQNLPRPTLKQAVIDQGIAALKNGTAAILFDNVMQLTSSAIRGCVVAPPHKKLVVADLSNIEGRVLAWLAGEAWKLRAFAEYDTVRAQDGLDSAWLSGPAYTALCRAGAPPVLDLDEKGEPVRRGHDLYKLSYGKSFGVAPGEVTKDQRQVGKVQELALGYEGGVGAFLTFAAAYGIDLEVLAQTARRAIPGEVWGRANIMLEWHRKQRREPPALTGLSEQAWLVCESFKIGWRDAHPNVVALWKGLDATVREAITSPGVTFKCGMLKVRRDGAWLRIVLPSGRALCYPGPALIPEKKSKRGVDLADMFAEPVAETEDTGRTIISYMGMNQYSRKWERIHTYGGKLVENATQAVARDIMAANMPAIEDEMYEIVLTVHDEILSEAPLHSDWNAEHLAALMATAPSWAEGLPLAAAGFEGLRYRKD